MELGSPWASEGDLGDKSIFELAARPLSPGSAAPLQSLPSSPSPGSLGSGRWGADARGPGVDTLNLEAGLLLGPREEGGKLIVANNPEELKETPPHKHSGRATEEPIGKGSS